MNEIRRKTGFKESTIKSKGCVDLSKEINDMLAEYARYKYVIENIKDVIWEIDSNFVFTFVSPALKEMVGYEAEEMTGKSVFDFLTPESKAYMLEHWKQKGPGRLNGSLRETALYDIQMICKNGERLWCQLCIKPVFNGNDFRGYIGTTRDISEKKNTENQMKIYLETLQYKNEQLEDLAALDMLTGAYNRRKFEYFVSLEIEKKVKYGTSFSIIMFDLDNFKSINDTFGHKKGDNILQDITVLIKKTLRATDKLFRWGGDEFIIFLPDQTLKNALKVADKIRRAIRLYDFETGDKEVSVSLGVGEYNLNETQDQFVTRVDNALLKAKSNGRNKVEQDRV